MAPPQVKRRGSKCHPPFLLYHPYKYTLHPNPPTTPTFPTPTSPANPLLHTPVAVITSDHSYRSSTAVSRASHSCMLYIVVTTNLNRSYKSFAAATDINRINYKDHTATTTIAHNYMSCPAVINAICNYTKHAFQL